MKVKDIVTELQKLSPDAEVNIMIPYCRTDSDGVSVSDYYRITKVSLTRDHVERGALPQSEWEGLLIGETWLEG